MSGERFVKVYKDAINCWLKLRLTGIEWSVLIYLASATWGWHRLSTQKSLGEIADGVSSNRRTVLRAIQSLKKAGLVVSEGEERRRNVFKLRQPGEYTEIEPNLVSPATPLEGRWLETDSLVTEMTKTGDKDSNKLVTRPGVTAHSPNNPLYKEKRELKKEGNNRNNNPRIKEDLDPDRYCRQKYGHMFRR